MHEIKSNIPLPEAAGRRGRAPVYHFAEMVNGQCFDTPVRVDETVAQAIKRMRTVSASYRNRHRPPMTFIVRSVTIEGGEVVIRVWARASAPPVKRIPAPASAAGVEEFFREKA